MLLLAVSGCATASKPLIAECLWVKPIAPSPEDVEVMSDSLVEQILNHNDALNEFCR